MAAVARLDFAIVVRAQGHEVLDDLLTTDRRSDWSCVVPVLRRAGLRFQLASLRLRGLPI
jgi:hypothetical protein